MTKSESSGNVEPRIPEEPTWRPPQPPSFGEKEWFRMIWERFGFLFISALVLVIIALLYLNADALLQNPEPWVPASAEEADAREEGGAMIVPLTLESNPPNAIVSIDGSMIGETPLRDHPLPAGTHRISLSKEGFSPRDTVLQSSGAPIAWTVTLMPLDGSTPVPEQDQSPPPDNPQPVAAEEVPDARSLPSDATEQVGRPDPPTSGSEAESVVEEANPQPDPGAPADVDDAPDELDSTVAESARAEDSLATQRRGLPYAVGTLSVTSEPPGAEVWLDGDRIGRTPLRREDVQVGPHGVLLRLAAHYDYGTSVDVDDGQVSEVHGELIQTTGTLSLTIRPWGDVTIDGVVKRRQAESYSESLTPGDHQVRVEHPRLGKWEQAVRIVPGEVREVVVDFSQ